MVTLPGKKPKSMYLSPTFHPICPQLVARQPQSYYCACELGTGEDMYARTHAHLLFSPKETLYCGKSLPANLLSDDSSELDFSMQVERIPQWQQAENVAPDRAT